MSQKEKDDRFSKVYNDPRFRTFRKVDKTLKIDNRFKSMFTDDKFKLKYSMDKRGKSKKHLIADDYKKFYRLSDEEEEEEEKEENENITNNYAEVEKLDQPDDSDGEQEDEKVDDEEEKELTESKLTHKFGYHRGLNKSSDDDSSSSSSSSESEESDDDEDAEVEHEWGELDKDTPQIENATSRIAICNADWDRINAQDLFVLLNSFKRATGAIEYVRIYYSKFGEERLKVEEQKGPSEFIFGKAAKVEQIEDGDDEKEKPSDNDGGETTNNDQSQSENDDDDEEGEVTDTKAMEKLRKYQLERLKYFYAVVGFDSAETAEVVYNELDGMEYESSSTMLDIRFVPEDMDFDDVKLKEECTSMPNSNTYKAPNFVNTALQQSQVTLTWDETDHKRKAAFEHAFDKDHEDDLKAYLATSSEDDDEEEDNVEIDANLKDDEKINKYKDLLKSLDKDKDDDIEMEVTWDPSLKSTTENLIKKKKNPTAYEGDDLNEAINNYAGDSENENSDDNIVQQIDDEDQEEEKKDEKSKKDKKSKDKYKKWKKKKAAKKESANNVSDEDSSKLELLMVDMDKGDGKKHFNYKEIVDNYSKKGKLKGLNDQGSEQKDSFKFDADDPRFSAIYSSHMYNIDQSDPNFKKTEAFDQILHRRKNKAAQMVKDEKLVQQNSQTSAAKSQDKAWKSLVNKVKDKTSSSGGGGGFGGHNKRPIENGGNKINSNARFNTNKKFKR